MLAPMLWHVATYLVRDNPYGFAAVEVVKVNLYFAAQAYREGVRVGVLGVPLTHQYGVGVGILH